jgi:hypothetical protein
VSKWQFGEERAAGVPATHERQSAGDLLCSDLDSRSPVERTFAHLASFLQGSQAMLDQVIDATFLYPLVVILFVGSAELGFRIGLRHRRRKYRSEDLVTLTASTLGLLALLLAFSLSHALSRYDDRRALVLEEANAIESTANSASMLPKETREPIFSALRDYAAIRIGLGSPYDLAKLDRDVANSRDLLTTLWQQAVAVSEPETRSAQRFINSLDEMTKIQERRVVSLRYHVPSAVLLMLLGMAIVAIWFTGYQSGLTETRLHAGTVIMALTIAVVIALVIDLDQPARGLVQVPTQALIDVAKGLPP